MSNNDTEADRVVKDAVESIPLGLDTIVKGGLHVFLGNEHASRRQSDVAIVVAKKNARLPGAADAGTKSWATADFASTREFLKVLDTIPDPTLVSVRVRVEIARWWIELCTSLLC